MTADKYTFEVQRLRDRMVAVATRMLDNRDEAEDVTQDALLKLWSVRKKLQESDIDRLAFVILRHLCIDELRRRKCRKGNKTVDIDSVEVAMSPEDLEVVEERERQLIRAVDKLPSRQRMLLRMRYIEGMEVSAIAELVGGSEDSVNMVLSRARRGVYRLMTFVVVAACLVLYTLLPNRIGHAPEMVHNTSGVYTGTQKAGVLKPSVHAEKTAEVVKPGSERTLRTSRRRKLSSEEEKLFAEVMAFYNEKMEELHTSTDYNAICEYAEQHFDEILGDSTANIPNGNASTLQSSF